MNLDFGVPWSAKEDEALRRFYVKDGARAVAARLGRSLTATQKRAARIGVLAKPLWSAEDDRRLAELWGLHATRSIAKRLGRSMKSVYGRAATRGLVAREREGMETLAEAAKRCGFEKRDLRRILRRAGALRTSVSRNAAGYKLRPSYQLDPFEVDEAVAEYVRGSSMVKAARDRGVSDWKLRRALERIGVNRPATLKRGEMWKIPDELADRALGRRAA